MTLDDLIEQLIDMRDVRRTPGFTPVVVQAVGYLEGAPVPVFADGQLDRVVYGDGRILLKGGLR